MRPVHPDPQGIKRCTQCHELKNFSKFYPRSDSPGKYMSACKDCRNARLRAKAAAESTVVRRSTISIHADGYALVSLHGKYGEGTWAKIDLDDIELVRPYKWSSAPGGYARASFGPANNRQNVTMHRLILGVVGIPFTQVHVDHRNHDTLDNRRNNLRKATPHQNAVHSISARGSSSRFKGVSWFPRTQRWSVQIRVFGPNLHLGTYKDEEDAARVYDGIARALFGEFAHLNLTPLTTRQAK